MTSPDTDYLLRFLRTAKFSQLKARTMIEGNLELRTKFPCWYHNLDTHDEDQMQPLKRGFVVATLHIAHPTRQILHVFVQYGNHFTGVLCHFPRETSRVDRCCCSVKVCDYFIHPRETTVVALTCSDLLRIIKYFILICRRHSNEERPAGTEQRYDKAT